MARRKNVRKPLFELDGIKMAQARGSENFELYRSNPVTGQVDRISTRTTNPEVGIALIRMAAARGITDLKAIMKAGSVRTVADLLAWHAPYAGRLKSAEVELIGARILTQCLGERSIAHLVPSDFDAFRDEMLKNGKSISYISRILSTLRKASNRAYDDRLIPARVKVPEYRTRAHIQAAPPKGAVLNDDAFIALWDQAIDPHLRLFLVCLLHTAARPGAVLELCGDQINWLENLLHLNPPGRLQTAKVRPTLPLAATLAPWLRHVGSGPIITYRDRPIREIDTAFKSACRRAGLSPGVNPYSIRHMVARRLRRAGVTSEEIAVFLGHRPTSVKDVTLTYSPYDAGFLCDATRAVEAYVRELDLRVKISLLTPPWL